MEKIIPEENKLKSELSEVWETRAHHRRRREEAIRQRHLTQRLALEKREREAIPDPAPVPKTESKLSYSFPGKGFNQVIYLPVEGKVVELGDTKAVNRARVDGGDAGDGLTSLVPVLLTGFDGGVVEVERVYLPEVTPAGRENAGANGIFDREEGEDGGEEAVGEMTDQVRLILIGNSADGVAFGWGKGEVVRFRIGQSSDPPPAGRRGHTGGG